MDMERDGDTVELERLRALARRRAAGVARLAKNVIPGLPVDSDPRELGGGAVRLCALLDESLDSMQSERNAFFDAVVDRWKSLFPDLPARPGRFAEGRVYLYVKSASLNFALRPKLPRVKRVLAGLEGAPKRFDVRLEIHA